MAAPRLIYAFLVGYRSLLWLSYHHHLAGGWLQTLLFGESHVYYYRIIILPESAKDFHSATIKFFYCYIHPSKIAL